MGEIREAPFSAVETDVGLAGPVRRPTNSAKSAKGSIHDDATAQKLGFRGGTVAGSVHMEQFPPLMAEALGSDWHRTGGLSLYFLNATTDGEPVQAFCGRVEDRPEGGRRAPVWMIDEASGQRVCEGTASVGPPDAFSALRQRLASVRPPGELRLLEGRTPEDRVTDVPARLSGDRAISRLDVITEDLPAYHDASVFGEIVATPAMVVQAMREVEVPLWRPKSPYVGMFGAIEVQMLDGPVFVEHDYLCDGAILALSDSPKTEVIWYEAVLRDARDRRPVARMILMSRLVKASSALWAT
ncbi:MAG TPA: hypothetical protein VFW47_14660 [Phenylobacterium sp.]|nr:hypothetical protein [Phenylobacterium sp.]